MIIIVVVFFYFCCPLVPEAEGISVYATNMQDFRNVFGECNQQDATFHNLFTSVRRSTCFRRFFSFHRQELKTAHAASGICQTVTATCRKPG